MAAGTYRPIKPVTSPAAADLGLGGPSVEEQLIEQDEKKKKQMVGLAGAVSDLMGPIA
jgi:hypothetical protein